MSQKEVGKKELEQRYSEVKNQWNEFAEHVGLPTVIALNEERRKAIRLRYDTIQPHIETIFDKIEASDFLMGRVRWGRKWRANFDFLWCRKHNWQKVLEGQYDNVEEEEYIPRIG